ncbi:MAG: hypothetical protein QXT05_02320 [Candidatus Bilamarchaeaceae archaeon]
MNRIGIIIFFSVLLLLCCVYFYFESERWRERAAALEEENAALSTSLIETEQKLGEEKATTASLRNELNELYITLNETNNSLGRCTDELTLERELYENCTEKSALLATELRKAREEMENLSVELSVFQQRINESMGWFKENSDIGILSPRIQYLIDRCSSGKEINLPCIPVIMKIEEDWLYKTEVKDTLLSINEFAENKGGDCEDWALFFKAAYNYLKAREASQEVVAAVPGSGNYKIYNNWFYKDAEKALLGTSEQNVYIICYNSHCVVALSNVTIRDGSDIQNLKGAPAIEPQSGQYYFTIGEPGAPSICSDTECDYGEDIWLVITDDDIYDFHYDNEWVGYKDYYKKAEDFRARIASVLSLIGAQ